ncbi:unnamed protein product [Schistocephalus solidus]|uniref:Uncharacterized protein n=1 Tax=Schistocephalus solidus TaxID=70667 RepID=A0A183TL13_SCHSO|nr:unnamed protein product [Schistocephalus solidus]
MLIITSSAAGRGSHIAKYVVIKLQQTTIHLTLSPCHTLRAAQVSPLTIAAWNGCSLLNNPRSNPPERMTALVARELTRYKLDIAALSETQYSEQAPRTSKVDTQALPTCLCCQRIFRARISLVGNLQTQCTINPTIPISTSNSADPPSDTPTLTPGINSITPTIIETTSLYSSPVTPTTAFAFTTTNTTSDGDSLF